MRLLTIGLALMGYLSIGLAEVSVPVAGHPLDTAFASDLKYPKTDKRHYLTEKQLLFIRPGLNIDVSPEDITIGGDGSVQVTLSVTDDRGQPLDLSGDTTPGPVRMSFVLSYLPGEGEQYVSYINRTVDGAVQATSDSGGSFESLGEGVYVYTFGNSLPAGFDANATHTLGIYADRNLGEFDLGTYIESLTVNFLPAGGEPTVIREIVVTEACHNCHDPLTLHGRRQGTDLCILCHYDETIDPDTGNDVDFREMIHKIHRGENLPSVQAGTPYQIIGYRSSVHDYSHVLFPQDIRNCTNCHVPEAAQADQYKNNPNMAACGSCHDDVNFATGEGHVGGPQVSDNFCANCHFPEGELEFDASIVGAHTIPSKSNQLDGINLEFLDVMNTAPGANPTVTFTLFNDMGDPISPADLDTFRLSVAGPTTDYDTFIRETATSATSTGNPGEFSYTFSEPIPADAEGSFTASVEIRDSVTLNAGLTTEMSTRDSLFNNPTFTFAVTDSAPVPRRLSVDIDNCNNCHDRLALHGGQRFETQYCVMCHQPGADDGARRPEEELPVQSIDFKFMIHRIHTGEELMWDYTVYGYGGSAHNYNEVVFPGDRRNCQTCHADQESYQVPSAGLLPTLATDNEFFAPIPPESAACLGCHDSQQAAAHAFLNAAPFGEACSVCHGEDADFAVDKVHARNE
jgi:OmcA/MtrC family decaheme c-type cytochrome